MFTKAHETRNHLFMECTFSMVLWKRVIHWLDATQPIQATWDAMLNWIVQRSKGKTPQAQLWKLLYVEVTYAIWKERNSRIFQQVIWKERNSRIFQQVEHNAEDKAKKIARVCCVRATRMARHILEGRSY
ncbi:hypothetical protein CQW23_30626 [Capsicum baccatum]|uniref:Reverse transcriptase zinc-binding domain-containing protein n=1 Tax=Capsicum baccatum TaxID=33114 RepID=A0A2G2VA44_CAPBA|nr:hypothetical protein CQW23_30626 [Capsicum baccatum]